jgi:hypothetical protein
MRSETKYEVQKVANMRFTPLASWILGHTDNGIDRGQIAEGYFGLERRYRGYFTDPCFRPTEKRRYEAEYKKAQPRITKTLKRVETLGLVHLVRQHSYVKRVTLTQRGREVAHELEHNQPR